MGKSTLKAGRTLLWTNSSPTTSFAGRTLNIDISKYKFLAVTTNWFANGNTNEVGCHLLESGTRGIVTEAKDVNGYRVFDLTNANQIVIGDGLQYTFSGGNSTENRRLAPIKIYGIK